MTTPLRVLIVEDSPDDAELMALRLTEEGFQPEWQRVQAEPDYLAALEAPPDLILADWSLPQFSGLRALQLMRERGSDIPFVIISGSIGEEAAIEALRLGASDYVLKDRPARLGQAVTRALEEKRLRDEKRQVERTLRESEEKFRAIYDNASDGMFLVDLEARKLSMCNAACARMLGYAQDEFLNLGIVDIHPEEDMPFIYEQIGRFSNGEVRTRSDIRFRRRDGSVFYADLSPALVVIAERRYLLLVFKNITERKQAEARIRHLNEVLRAVRDVDQLITRERDPQRLMSEACAILVRTRSYHLAWIGLIEKEHRRVIPAARAGQSMDYLDQVTITWDESETGQGPTGTAIRTRRPTECHNIAIDPRYAPWREAALAYGFGSSVAVPMVYGERLFGVVNVYADQPEAFDEEEIGLLSELADDMAFALQSAEDEAKREHAEEMLQQHTRSMALINAATRAFSSSLDLNQVFATVLEEARRLLDIAASSIWLIDPETQELVCHQATGRRCESVIGWRLAPGEGIAGWVTTHGESLIVPDVEADERHSADVNRHIGLKVRSILSVPLRSKQSVIGVLQMLDSPVGRFSAKDLDTLEPLAASAAIAIENARLYQQARQEIAERRQAEKQLRQSEAALKQAQEVAHVGSWRWHIQSDRLEWSDEMYRIFGIEKGAFSGELSQVIERAIHPDDRVAVEQSNRSVIEHKRPMPLEYRIVWPDGTIRVVWGEAGELTMDDDGGPQVVTGIVQDITERKQAEVALQRYVERLRILRAIDGVVLAAQSPQEIGQAILRHLQKLVPSDRVLVSSFDLEKKQATVLASIAGGKTWLEAGTQIELEAFGSIENLQTGKVSVVGDAQALDDTSLGQSGTLFEDARSYLHIPLIAQGELGGSLLLASEHPAAFTAEHVEIAGELSGQLAIGLHQARLREQIQRHTEELEQQVTVRTAQLARRTAQLRVAAEVARDATTARDLDELLNRSVSLVRDRFGFYHAGIFLIDERGEYAVLRAATGEAGQQMLEHGHRLKVGAVGIVGHACASGEPRIALDVGGDAVYFDNPFLPDTRSEMALPMRAGGNVIGALDVQSRKESAFDQDDVEIMQVMADQLAVAIERTRLFERTQTMLEERLRTVISSTPVVLFAMDREGRLILVEGKGLETIGLKPDETLGQSIFEARSDQPHIREVFERALTGDEVSAIEKTGDLVIETTYAPLRGENGEIVGVIGVAVDVTERHRMQEQMQQQERLAAVGQLAGGIAHDFNNFLMTIVFYAHLLLRDESLSSDVTSIAETIVGEANRAAALVRQVLDFSRRSVMEIEPVDLSSFVAEVMDILQKTLPENIRVMTEVGDDDYTVEIDPTRIQQVIMNLALNSRDAMPNGGSLRIELSRVTVDSREMHLPGNLDLELAAGDWVCLSVQDTGTGIDEHVRAHLFEPFFTTKGPKGNGLGLAQVYGIVKQHQGEIGVETEMGRGTTFRIYLPAYMRNHAQGAETEEIAIVPRGRGETILFVEDEDRVRDAGQRVLQSLGYRILTASNGGEALKVFQESGEVDLVLTDMVMPEMGGRELIQELRQIVPDVKALVITGYTMQEDVQALKEIGFADIVYKPLDIGVLGKTVRRILDAGT